MNKTLKIILAVIGGIVLSIFLFCAGLFAGRTNLNLAGYGPKGMMGLTSGGYKSGYTLFGNGNNMMGGYQSDNAANVKPLTLDQVKQAAENYLKGLNNSDLEIKEIMVFDNNAYVRITEKSTGIGAMELLVDPTSLSVFPEYGANMMWNLKYGLMSGAGGMMGGYNNTSGAVSATMTVTADQAVKIAQKYLDQQYPGYQADTNPDPFYGYYTIDILKDGKPTGMLSVNGFSGQIILHTWHGTFIDVSE